MSDDQTHHAACWRDPAHHACAVARVEAILGTTRHPRPAKFVSWVADRLVDVHGESENVDYVLGLRRLAAALAALGLEDE